MRRLACFAFLGVASCVVEQGIGRAPNDDGEVGGEGSSAATVSPTSTVTGPMEDSAGSSGMSTSGDLSDGSSVTTDASAVTGEVTSMESTAITGDTTEASGSATTTGDANTGSSDGDGSATSTG